MAVQYEDFSKIIPSLLHLKDQYSTAEGYDADIYNNVILYLHQYNMHMGDIVSSERLLEEAEKTFALREPETNNKYIRNLMICRGQLEVMLKRYDAALDVLTMAHAYFVEAADYGDEYIIMMNNIAVAYQLAGNLVSAKVYMDEAIERYEKLYGSIFDIKNEAIYTMLENFGRLYAEIGHEKEAEKCLLAVINKSKNDFLSHEAYTHAVNDLSVIYMKQGRWNDGAKLLEGLKADNDENNYLYSQNRCMCYSFLNDAPKAIEALKEMNELSLKNFQKIFASLSQVSWESYWTMESRERIFVNNLVAFRTQSPQALGIAYDNVLYCKNLLVNYYRIIDKLATESADEGIKQRYSRYKNLKEQLAYKLNENNRDSVSKELKDTERSLLAGIKGLGDWTQREAVSWRKVRESLAGDEAAIEFSYVPHMEKYPDMKPHYGAFVIRKDYEYPLLVSLDEVDSVAAVFYKGNHDRLAVSRLYTDRSNTLYNKLWRNLAPYLKGVKTVYYSTVGPLSEVNFDVLQDEHGRMLGDKYSMARVSSTGNIAAVKQSYALPLHTSILYGNITYDETPEDMAAVSSQYDGYTGMPISSALSSLPASERGGWGSLPSTKKEIDGIGNILASKGLSVETMEGTKASEESFKALGGKSPDVIHLATHGFLIQTQQQAQGNKFFGQTTAYSPKEAYMMWTGLMLAGSNNVWQGKFDLQDVEDGVLTADEISRMDLSRTKLVVLSACETGKGKVDPVDGVYGLQRAFKIAGAGTIVMSLWKVQDEVTSLLMTKFYSYLADSIDRHQALWKSMMDIRTQYPDPYYWAGFIMLD